MIKDSIWMAWSSLVHNKLRTLLTMLGIIIGVAAVIALVSIGYGVRHKIESNLSTLGTNLLIVYPSPSGGPGVRPAPGALKRLTIKDYESISKIPSVAAISPVMRRSYDVTYKNNHWSTTVTGINQEYLTVTSRTLLAGRFITSEQVLRRERVAVIGTKVQEKLFGESTGIGQMVRIANQTFRVIGVLESKGSNAFGNDEDDTVLIPYTTYMERLTGQTFLGTLFLIGKDTKHLEALEMDIQNILRLHHQSAPGVTDFAIDNMASILKKVQETTGTLTLFLGAIAAISLLVGGIGIMNIMLVSVTERTKEIGIRKALGATYRIIMLQFLVEAIVISLCGGLLGVVLGMTSSVLIGLAIDMETIISPMTIVMAFTFSMGIGIVFGLYPARKAAKLNPIEALHYE